MKCDLQEKTDIISAWEKICDGYCRYPSELDQEELDAKCGECPLAALEEMICG